MCACYLIAVATSEESLKIKVIVPAKRLCKNLEGSVIEAYPDMKLRKKTCLGLADEPSSYHLVGKFYLGNFAEC